ncbi:MAG: toll/interleukin-1 receptor domain-containing protein [Smithella sp.]
MSLNIKELMDRAKGYVETEAETKVIEIKLEEIKSLFGKEDAIFSVLTADSEYPEWWVIGGTLPMNLYNKRQYTTPDEVFSMHTGIILRMMEDDIEQRINGEYDAFISHASEDKAKVVRPLAKSLKRMGLKVWYDEFELKVGDSLRQSIDEGLSKSHYGIIILSKSFFEKNWPQYELNGLVSKEIDGENVILPIWHGVTKDDVVRYSPSLADKLALSTDNLTINKLAKELVKVILD